MSARMRFRSATFFLRHITIITIINITTINSITIISIIITIIDNVAVID
jgi:hypothetical protein